MFYEKKLYFTKSFSCFTEKKFVLGKVFCFQVDSRANFQIKNNPFASQSVRYRLENGFGLFRISDSGQVILDANLDYDTEDSRQYHVRIYVTDGTYVSDGIEDSRQYHVRIYVTDGTYVSISIFIFIKILPFLFL